MDTSETSDEKPAEPNTEHVVSDEATERSRLLIVGDLPMTLQALQATHGDDWIQLQDIPSAHDWLVVHEPTVRQVWLCATHSGQFNQAGVDFLIEHWPLLSILYVACDWCQGELRSGWPVQGVPRRLLSEVIDEVSGSLRTFDSGERQVGPRTAQVFEQWLEAEKYTPATTPLHVLIVTEWRETWEALRDCLQLVGHSTSWWQPGNPQPTQVPAEPGPRAVVVDFSRGLAGAETACVRQLTSEFVRRVAVMGFPRSQDVRELQRMGFDEVIFKPLRINLLLNAIDGTGSKVDS